MMARSSAPGAQDRGTRFVGVALAVTMGLMALVLIAAGAWLLRLGGSPYYLLTGLVLAATAGLLHRRLRVALWLYAALFIASLAWALWEAGLDWWPLAARMGLLFIIGALLLLPPLQRAFGDSVPAGASPRRGGAVALAGALGLFALVAIASWWHDPWTLAGRLPDAAPPAAAAAGGPPDGVPDGEWQAYGRTAAGQRYSPLTQITVANVDHLEMAWTYHTGDLRGRPGDPDETTFEATPLKVGNRLYFCTPHQSVVALDATTGRPLWRRDLQLKPSLALQHLTCRGLSYSRAEAAAPMPARGAASGCLLYTSPSPRDS